MSTLEMYLFGPPRLVRDGQTIELGLRKALALFVYLSVTREPHSRDKLATLFWGEEGQREARANLRRALYRIHETLGKAMLATTDETIILHPQAVHWLDVEAFQQLLSQTGAVDGPTHVASSEVLAQLGKAVALYTDDFLTGFVLPDCPDFDDWQFFQREGLRLTLAKTLDRLTTGHEARQELEQAIFFARRRLTLDPIHEPAHRQLMQLYARAGQQAAALRQYDECVRVLAAELGAPPEEATTALYEAIRSRRIGPAAEASVVAPPLTTTQDLRPAPAFRHNLPTPSTPFIGRQTEVAAILQTLGDPACRLLTLVGPGGIGKSRLAIEAAHRLAQEAGAGASFADGVFWVALNGVDDLGGIAPAIAGAIGLTFEGGAPAREQLFRHLRRRRLLLVLDNFEHLVDEASLVAELLAAAPDTKLLITSREAINIQEEWFHTVSGMAFPESVAGDLSPDDLLNDHTWLNYDAVQFFTQCALRAQPGFSPLAEAPHVMRICRMAEGMPLALELAASWLKALTVEHVADELARGLDILSARHRNLPERHRSMVAAFETSWQQLSAPEQRAFAALAVFQGGFTLIAAQRVTNISLPLLSNLVNKSLLRRERDGRYTIHELLRQYGGQKLADSPDEEQQVRDRHCQFYGAFLQARQVELKGEQQVEALNAIGMEIENIRLGWHRALAPRGDYGERAHLVERYLDALFHFYDMRSQFRLGEETFRHAVEQMADGAERHGQIVRAKLLGRQGWFTFHRGESARGRALLQQSAEGLLALGAQADAVFSLNYLGAVCRHMGDYAAARPYLRQSLALAETHGDRFGMSVALNILGQIALLEEDLTAARRACQESLAIKRAIGDRWGALFSLLYLGDMARMEGDLWEARRLYEESLAISRSIGDRRGEAICLGNLGELTESQGDFATAADLYQQSLTLFDEIHNAPGVLSAHARLGNLARKQGDDAAAAQHDLAVRELTYGRQAVLLAPDPFAVKA